MAFITRKYLTDAGTVVQIRMSTASAAVPGNTEPAGALDDERIFAFSSNPGSKKKKALNARGIVLGRQVGTAPDTFTRRTFVPISTLTGLNGIAVGTSVTLPSGVYTVRDKVSEA